MRKGIGPCGHIGAGTPAVAHSAVAAFLVRVGAGAEIEAVTLHSGQVAGPACSLTGGGTADFVGAEPRAALLWLLAGSSVRQDLHTPGVETVVSFGAVSVGRAYGKAVGFPARVGTAGHKAGMRALTETVADSREHEVIAHAMNIKA